MILRNKPAEPLSVLWLDDKMGYPPGAGMAGLATADAPHVAGGPVAQ